MDDGTKYMPEWAVEHADNTQQLVFADLVRYLEEIVPGFSGAELRRRAADTFATVKARTEQDVVTEWMEREEKEIISTMIPRSIYE